MNLSELARQDREAVSEVRNDALQMSHYGGGWGGSGYQGAMLSSGRGYVYWPTVDPVKEIDAYSRMEIARRVHALYANAGIPRRIIIALSNLIVGTGLRPQALTEDHEWNDLAVASYIARSKSKLTYDAAGAMTGRKAQSLMTRTRLKDGDAAVVFTSSETGGAMRAFYSGVQIGSEMSADEDSRWRDGILPNDRGRTVMYRLLDGNGQKAMDIPASSVCWLMNHESPGQQRGMSALSHCVNKMVDLSEIGSSIVHGIKSSNQTGLYIAKQVGSPTGGTSVLDQLKAERNTAAQKTANESVTQDSLYHMGPGGDILELPEGREIKTLLDQRPSQNTMEYLEHMIRDASAGTGVSPDLLWNIYKLGGATVRYVMAEAQVYVQDGQQDLVDSWLNRDWTYHCAKEMKAGRLRKCNDPEWWKHGWVTPERVTVDFGRDGKMHLERWKSMLLTTGRLFGMSGQDAREELNGELELIKWFKKRMEFHGLTTEDLKLLRGGTAAGKAAQIDADDPDDGDDESKKKSTKDE